MKNIITAISILLSVLPVHAQISVTSLNAEGVNKEKLPFTGDRLLYIIGVDDKNTRNFFAVSKNAVGAAGDKLYIEKFTKGSDGKPVLSFQSTLQHTKNRALVFVNNRGFFTDIDKDGDVEFLSVVETHEKGMDAPADKIEGIICFKNKAYRIWALQEDGYKKNYYNDGYNALPDVFKKEIEKFWENLKGGDKDKDQE